MEFDDIFELFESVRLYRLREKERIIPAPSVNGTVIGYTTADSDFPAVTWTIKLRTAKESALARGTKESRRIRELLATHAGRRELLEELRAGSLEYGIARPPPPPPEPVEIAPPVPEGPRQCMIPGL